MVKHTHLKRADEDRELLDQMYRDRKSVFIDIMGWGLRHEDGKERDQYDNDQAEYLILKNPQTGGHLASVRLLPTNGPHLLGDVFPSLCAKGVPRSPKLMEITRMCVSPSCRREDRSQVNRLIVSALVEYALLMGLEGYTAITSMRYLARTLAAGWHCEMLGFPREVDGEQIAALRIDINASTIQKLQAVAPTETDVLEIGQIEKREVA